MFWCLSFNINIVFVCMQENTTGHLLRLFTLVEKKSCNVNTSIKFEPLAAYALDFVGPVVE